jgi:hypothetical protein
MWLMPMLVFMKALEVTWARQLLTVGGITGINTKSFLTRLQHVRRKTDVNEETRQRR